MREKCRFGSNFHSFIVLKCEQHTSKQDSCIDNLSKQVKMHRKPKGGVNKHGKNIIARSGKGKGMHEATSIMAMHPKWLHPDKALWVSVVTTQP